MKATLTTGCRGLSPQFAKLLSLVLNGEGD
jgi:hypothetical protein